MKSSRRVLARQWRLVQELTGSRMGLSIQRLQEATESSRSTVYRDLELLRQAGVPIEPVTVNGEARYRMLRPLELPMLGLNALQISALHLARAELQGLAGAGFVSELDVLLARYGPPERQLRFRFAAKTPEADSDRGLVMKDIERALSGRRRARIEYRAAKRSGERSVLEIEPLFVNVVRGEPYLRAYCIERQAERTYKLIRISRFELLKDAATYQPEQPAHHAFDHSVKAWTGKPGAVRVRLDSEVAWLAPEYPLIADQRLASNPDGSVTVTANVAGVTEAMRWVLSWGGAAEALSPPELRDATRAELERAVAKYRGPGVARAGRRAASVRRNKVSRAS
jgi:predicted DNA-binding transcriptional regulator YafY